MALDRSVTVLIRKQVEMIALLDLYLAHFPKHEKYALSQYMRVSAMDVYKFTVEGYKRYHKKTTLQNLDIAHETLRMQIYLAEKRGYFAWQDGRKTEHDTHNRYKKLSMLCDEVGAMIGEWIKVNERTNNG